MPQYVVGGSYSSRVYLANAAVQAATVRLTLFGSDGHALAAPLIRTIGPRSGLSLPPSSFGLSESSSKTVDGYLQLDVESGSVVGNVTFQDLSGTLFLAGTNTLEIGRAHV